MPSSNPSKDQRTSATVEQAHEVPQPSSKPTLGTSEERLEIWAELIASDRSRWPDRIETEAEADLLSLVRKKRREQLIRIVARQIALHLYRESREKGMTPC